jgi:hypothetical protein
MKKIAILFICFIAFLSLSNAQTVQNNSFKSGEKLKFVASYYMSSLWADLAEISMDVSDMKTSTQDLYRLKCTASTYQSWDSYFKIRDLYESYVDKVTVKPYLFKRSVEEGTYKKNAKYVYKWKSGIVSATIQRMTDPEYKMDIDIAPNTYDIVSLIYLIRTMDFSKKKIGDIIKTKVMFDEKEEVVTIKYAGIETINVANYGKKQCYKLSISLKDDKVLKGKDSNNVWFTADKNMIPVLIKAEIPVGSVQIRLVEMAGLKN